LGFGDAHVVLLVAINGEDSGQPPG